MSQLGACLLEPSLRSLYSHSGQSHIHTNIELCDDWKEAPAIGAAALVLIKTIELITPLQLVKNGSAV